MRVRPVAAGSAVNDTFMLVNVGRTPCSLSSMTLDSPSGAFDFPYPNQVATPKTLAFRQLTLVNVRFTPTAVGADAATLTVVSDDGSNPTHTMAIGGTAF